MSSFVGSSSDVDDDPTLTVPSGTVEGNQMVALIALRRSADSITTVPSGWVLQESGSMPVNVADAVSDPTCHIYLKEADADDETGAGTDTYQWLSDGSSGFGILICVDAFEWGEFAKNEPSGTNTSTNAPSVTTTVASEIVYHCFLLDSGSATDPGKPSGTERLDQEFGATNDGGGRLTVIEEVFVSTGSTGTKAFTHASNEAAGFTFSLRDEGGGGGGATIPIMFHHYSKNIRSS